jgi:hypothetical protein
MPLFQQPVPLLFDQLHVVSLMRSACFIALSSAPARLRRWRTDSVSPDRVGRAIVVTAEKPRADVDHGLALKLVESDAHVAPRGRHRDRQ